jgi:hypothetical protein
MHCPRSWPESVATVEVTQVTSAEKDSNSHFLPAFQNH